MWCLDDTRGSVEQEKHIEKVEELMRDPEGLEYARAHCGRGKDIHYTNDHEQQHTCHTYIHTHTPVVPA
jgi:hypothetical protein